MAKRLSSWFSKTTSEEREARRRSREIDVMLKRTAQEPVAIRLFGVSESGKSTFLKQMRIIHGREFSQQELLGYRPAVYKGIVRKKFEGLKRPFKRGMQALFMQKNRLGIPWQDTTNEKHEELVNSAPWNMHLEPQTFQPYVNAINSLWKDAGIQETYSKCVRINYWVTKESLKYFLHNIDRISQLSYVPSHQDYLYLHEHKMNFFIFHHILIDKTYYMQRHCEGLYTIIRSHLECSTPLLFMVASNEYDRVLLKDIQFDEDDNSLIESLKLFKLAINNRSWFYSTVILFLNKTDLLAEKVKTADIRKDFPEFRGDSHSLEEVQEFLVQCFKTIMGNDRRPFYHHFTTAVDTENIRIAFDSVKDIIMHKNLKKSQVPVRSMCSTLPVKSFGALE